MDVLDDHHGELVGLAQGSHERVEQHVALSRSAVQLLELSTCLGGDVGQRAQGAWREEPVAAAPPPVGVGQGELELLEQRRLPDTGLAGDQDESPLPGPRLIGVARQGGELSLALENDHTLDCAEESGRS